LLKIKQLSELLNVSDQTIRRWVKDGMPHYRVGITFRFDEEEVRAWMKGRQ
jgi:excisionase family DNA binding protein